LQKPDGFVEDPVGVLGAQEHKLWQVLEDLFDVDLLLEDTIVQEENKAQVTIDGHVYVEDVDDESIPVPLDKNCKKLLKQSGILDGVCCSANLEK
jgi:sensor domain CHASE-containing protein